MRVRAFNNLGSKEWVYVYCGPNAKPMDDYQHSLDHDYLEANQENRIDRHWSVLVLLAVGLKVISTFFFIFEVELPPDVNTYSNIVFTLIFIYLVWFVKRVCNLYFGVSSVNVPVLLIIIFSFMKDAYYLFVEYSPFASAINNYQQISILITAPISIFNIWLLVLMFRLPDGPLKKYMLYWAWAIIGRMCLRALFPLLALLSGFGFPSKSPLENTLWLLPDLVLVYMILRESRLGVVGSKMSVEE